MQLPLAELIQKFEAEGASEILLLSLDRVGTAQGPNHTILKDALSYATVPVLVGGGVRDIADVRRLQMQGASGALVATALHNGTITKDHLHHL
jgi:phosphoribosylformimino-5-aminoimidazole carboxamide ribotide isomerase